MIFRNRKPVAETVSPFGVTGSPSGEPTRDSKIGQNAKVVGDLYSRGDVHLNGKVEGSIVCRHLTLGDEPEVSGEITTESVRVCGHFNGNISALQVVLTKSAVVSGEILHSSLEIEPGADVQGMIRHLSPECFPVIEFDDDEEQQTEEFRHVEAAPDQLDNQD